MSFLLLIFEDHKYKQPEIDLYQYVSEKRTIYIPHTNRIVVSIPSYRVPLQHGSYDMGIPRLTFCQPIKLHL